MDLILMAVISLGVVGLIAAVILCAASFIFSLPAFVGIQEICCV